MERRCIENRLQVESVQLEEGEIQGPLRTAFLDAAVKFAKTLKLTRDKTIYTGTAGIALTCLKLSRYFSEFRKEAKDLLSISTRRAPKEVSFIMSGGEALVAHENKAARNTVLYLETEALRDSTPDELLYGRAGYLYSLLILNQTNPCREIISKVVKKLLRGDSKFMVYQFHGREYVGAAHGLIGIYYLLLLSRHCVNGEVLLELLKKVESSVDELCSRHQFTSGNFPAVLFEERDKLVHWCHGAPGAVFLLCEAYRVYEKQVYLDSALAAGEVVWKYGLLKKGHSLCHGVSGNGYSLLALYKLTKNVLWLERACEFGEVCLQKIKYGDREYSLFEGIAGKVCFLVDLIRPEDSSFPGFEILQINEYE